MGGADHPLHYRGLGDFTDLIGRNSEVGGSSLTPQISWLPKNRSDGFLPHERLMLFMLSISSATDNNTMRSETGIR